ncbi:uncharacterized protein BO80DRAFT_157544 [Aspergillus ibericus CBS 121593]|uniref:Uncharacterized protein n=1 Tax=Aspergillus ibericus CBS 121593 TaxID=1448316 RepID=A0A395GSH5_9EURO|nr:hypothetical protein BO80DRAFT_157544 [Aspergillus ibericus CBS 121593]RAK98485.1 hypothetical protein BO80DRAFT_157544 [Aspergillus ibericus CBS 121593]
MACSVETGAPWSGESILRPVTYAASRAKSQTRLLRLEVQYNDAETIQPSGSTVFMLKRPPTALELNSQRSNKYAPLFRLSLADREKSPCMRSTGGHQDLTATSFWTFSSVLRNSELLYPNPEWCFWIYCSQAWCNLDLIWPSAPTTALALANDAA